uniref:Uncharacterized protein n=1 Tax=Oryza brachyantha TaxID=4533 RepID=J3LPZ3_ORYBR
MLSSTHGESLSQIREHDILASNGKQRVKMRTSMMRLMTVRWMNLTMKRTMPLLNQLVRKL